MGKFPVRGGRVPPHTPGMGQSPSPETLTLYKLNSYTSIFHPAEQINVLPEIILHFKIF